MNHIHHNIVTTETTTDFGFWAQATEPQAENRAEEPRKLSDLGRVAKALRPQAVNKVGEPRKFTVLRRSQLMRRSLKRRR